MNDNTQQPLTPEELKELRADPRRQPQWDNYDDELKQSLLKTYHEYNGISEQTPAKPTAAQAEQRELRKAIKSIISDLYKARQKAGLTQAEMAAQMGVSQSTLARLEGDQSNPSLKTLVKMAHVLGVSVRIG